MESEEQRSRNEQELSEEEMESETGGPEAGKELSEQELDSAAGGRISYQQGANESGIQLPTEEV